MARAAQRGFTLFELLVSMAVAVVLLAVVLPSFNDWIGDRRLRLAAQSLADSLQLVRSEAVSSGHPSTLLVATSGELGQHWVARGEGSCTTLRCLHWRAAADIAVSRVDAVKQAVEFDRDGQPQQDSSRAVCLTVNDRLAAKPGYAVWLRPTGSAQLAAIPAGELACQ